MGRKFKSTKSGKYMNPTDQARKEARKRELKKNKKQRLIVRAAVLKGKDPYQIISDLERLDKMEFDYNNPPSLNEKVLKDKRRKLRETWDRLCRLYSKEDKDKYQEMKRMENDYENWRRELIKQYEAIKSAQEVNLDEIPLPSMIPESSTAAAPLSTSSTPVSVSILKNKKTTKQPPGCPPGLPPTLEEFLIDGDDNSDDDNDVEITNKKKIKFADEVDDDNEDGVEDGTGGNLQKFLQEIEQLSGDKNAKQLSIEKPLTTATLNDEKMISSQEENKPNDKTNQQFPPPALPIPPSLFPPSFQKPMPMTITKSSPMPFFGSSPNTANLNQQQQSIVQPAPPIIPPKSSTTTSSSSRLTNVPVAVMTPSGKLVRLQPQQQQGQFFSGLPSNNPHHHPPHHHSHQHSSISNNKQKTATIEARPQLRNLSADSTKFMPLALRVKRDEKHQSSIASRKPINKSAGIIGNFGIIHSSNNSRTTVGSSTTTTSGQQKDKTNSKDDAYEQFMKEMNGLI